MQTLTASQAILAYLERDRLTSTKEIIEALGDQWPERNDNAWIRLVAEVRKRYNLQLTRDEKNAHRDAPVRKLPPLDVQSIEAAIDQLPEIRPHADVDPVTMNLRGCQRLAADVVREAWETANRGGPNATSFDVRYARAWLQTPSATAMWCDLAGVDPDEVARLSQYNHGRPTFSEAEIHTHEAKLEAVRTWNRGYKGSASQLVEDLRLDWPSLNDTLVLRAIIGEIQGDRE